MVSPHIFQACNRIALSILPHTWLNCHDGQLDFFGAFCDDLSNAAAQSSPQYWRYNFVTYDTGGRNFPKVETEL